MDHAELPEFVERDADLRRRNTLALPGRAALYAHITTPEQLAALAEHYAPGDRRCFVLGGGSNLVLSGTDGHFDGLGLHMAIPGRTRAAEDDDAADALIQKSLFERE